MRIIDRIISKRIGSEGPQIEKTLVTIGETIVAIADKTDHYVICTPSAHLMSCIMNWALRNGLEVGVVVGEKYRLIAITWGAEPATFFNEIPKEVIRYDGTSTKGHT